MTDLDAMSALAWVLCAVFALGGFLLAAWGWRVPRARFGRACYAAALVNHGVDVDVARAEAEWWYRPGSDELEVEAFDEVPVVYAAAVRDVPPAAGRELGDDGGGEGASGVLAGSGHDPALALEPAPIERCDDCGAYPGWPHTVGCRNDVPRPGEAHGRMGMGSGLATMPETRSGPGHRGYGPYLAAIGRDDPAGWYANLTAGEPPPEPGPRAEPAWVERLLHQGAISTAWCEATLHDTAEYFRADEAAVDYQIEQWVKAARFQLVGSRSWPPPELEAVA